MVESGASADVVKAKQSELAKQFLATADSMGVPADAAHRVQQIYGLTPEEVTTLFKAETEQTKTALTQYLSNLRAIFPGDGNTAVFQTILEGINSGAITSMDQVSSKMDELRKNVSTDGSGKYTIVLDADGTQAIVATDIVKKHAELFKAGSDGNGYTTKLNADDLTKATLDYVEGNLNAYDQLAPSADLNAKDNSGPAKASADANASNWDAQHPTASFDGDAAGAANAKRSASNQGWQWNGSTYNAQFGASTKSVSSSFWSAMQSGWEWAKQKFFAVFGVKRQNAEGGEVAGSGVTKTGRVVGQGNNTSDSVPLNAYTDVSTGEYVIRKAAVQSMENLYGRGIMAAINATGSIPSKYIADARRTSQITMPSGGLNGGYKSGGWSMPIETSSGDTYNQTFIYPSVTPIEVQKNNKLDQYANLGLLQ